MKWQVENAVTVLGSTTRADHQARLVWPLNQRARASAIARWYRWAGAERVGVVRNDQNPSLSHYRVGYSQTSGGSLSLSDAYMASRKSFTAGYGRRAMARSTISPCSLSTMTSKLSILWPSMVPSQRKKVVRSSSLNSAV